MTNMTRDEAACWASSPIVQHAVEATGGDPLLVLEKMRETMLDLEDRFPGIPFGAILAPQRRYDKGKMCKALVAEGWGELEAKSLLGYDKVRQ